MTVRRFALLIGSNRATSSTLPGVDKDMTDFATFLRSDGGGAWEPNEMLSIPAPSLTGLSSVLALTRTDVDYLLLVFGGHGGCDPDTRKSYVCLNDRDNIPVSELGNRARRQLIISDACRTLEPMILPESTVKVSGSRPVLAAPVPTYRQTCRALYDAAIAGAEEGTVVMHSCSVNQEAGDTHLGGVFTQLLLRMCRYWAQDTSDGLFARSVRRVDDVFPDLKRRTTEKNYPQEPVLQHGRRRIMFPIAVA